MRRGTVHSAAVLPHTPRIAVRQILLVGIVAASLAFGGPDLYCQPFLDDPIELSVDTEISDHYQRQRIQTWGKTDTSSIIVATEFEQQGDTVRALLKAWVGGQVLSLDDGRAVPMDWVATVPVSGGYLVAWNDYRVDAPGLWTARISHAGETLVSPSLYLANRYAKAIASCRRPGKTLLLLGYRNPVDGTTVTGLITASDTTTTLSEITPLATGLPSARWSWQFEDGRSILGIDSDTLYMVERDGSARYIPLPTKLFESRHYFVGDSLVIFYSDSSLIAYDITRGEPELWRLPLPEAMQVEHVFLSFDSIGFYVESIEKDESRGPYVGCYRTRRWHADLNGVPIDTVVSLPARCAVYAGGAFQTSVGVHLTPGVGAGRNDMTLAVSISVTLYFLGHSDNPRHHSSKSVLQAFGREEDERETGYLGVAPLARVRERGKCLLYDPVGRTNVLSLNSPPVLTDLSKTWPTLGHSGPMSIGWYVSRTGTYVVRDGEIPRQEMRNDSNVTRIEVKRPIGVLFPTHHGWIGISNYGDEQGQASDIAIIYAGSMVVSRLPRDEAVSNVVPVAYSALPSGVVSKMLLRYLYSDGREPVTELLRIDRSGQVRGRTVVKGINATDRVELLCLGEEYTGIVISDSVVRYIGPLIGNTTTDTLRHYPGFRVVATAVLADSTWVRLLTNPIFGESILEHYAQSGEFIRNRALDFSVADEVVILPHSGGKGVAVIEHADDGIRALLLGSGLETISAGLYRSSEFLSIAQTRPQEGGVIGRWSDDTLVVAWQGVNNDSIPVVHGNVMTLASDVIVVDRGPDLPADYIRREERRKQEEVVDYDYWEQYRTGDPEVIRQLTPEQRQDIFGFAIHGVTPNPTYGDVTLRISAAYSLGAYLEIFDAAGKRLYRGVLDLRPGTRYYRVPEEFGETGVYSIRISSPEYADEVQVVYIGR